MANFKRKFYIIGHNPNNLDLAEEYLRNGANALEPDIVFKDQHFFVCHGLPDVCLYDRHSRLEMYLAGIKKLIKDHNLALIVFDIKDTNFNLNELVHIIKTHLTPDVAAGLSFIFTHSSKTSFVCEYDQSIFNAGIGVDQSPLRPSQLELIFQEVHQKHFIYSFGGNRNLPNFGEIFNKLMYAKNLQVLHGEDSFKLIYSWVIARESSFKACLDLKIDGMIVDLDSVRNLRALIAGEFSDRFELAHRGYNPFTAPFPPMYLLHITTSDRRMSGTDALVKFTLTNTTGGSVSNFLNGKIPDVMESGSINFISLEGENIGTSIKSLTLEMLSEDSDSDWLPSKIIVKSRLLPSDLEFTYGRDEWLSFDERRTITHTVS